MRRRFKSDEKLLLIEPDSFQNQDNSSKNCRARQLLASLTDTFLFWDIHGHTIKSLQYLFVATACYIVCCAWYTWSVLSFQNLFTFFPGGAVLGLFVYATAVTCVLVAVLTSRSVRKEHKQKLRGLSNEKIFIPTMNEAHSSSYMNNDDEDSDDDKNEDGMGHAVEGKGIGDEDRNLKRREFEVSTNSSSHIQSNAFRSLSESSSPALSVTSQKPPSLFLVVGRLTIGWSWEEAITVFFAHFIVNGNSRKKWVDTLVKCFSALVAILVGAQVELYFQARQKTSPKECVETLHNVSVSIHSSPGSLSIPLIQ